MNSSNGALDFEAVLKTRDFDAGIRRIENQLRGVTRTAEKEAVRMDQVFAGIGRLGIGVGLTAGLAQLPAQIVKVRGEIQKLEIAFTTLLKSKERSEALMKDIVEFATTTPFEMNDVARATNALLSYGFASESVLKTLRRLGDISAGLDVPLKDLAVLYGKTRTNGRLFAEDFNQFVERGIPLIQILSKQFNVAEEDVRKLVETGKVGFKEVEQAIVSLTDTGGMFSGLSNELSKSIPGLTANLSDSVDKAFNKIGKSQEGIIVGSIKAATAVVDNYEDILAALSGLIAGYGTYKAALIAITVTQKAAGVGELISGYLNLGKVLGPVTKQQQDFNDALKLNGYAALFAVLVAATVVLYNYSDAMTAADKAQVHMNDAMEEATTAISQEIASITTLSERINNEKLSRDERTKSLNQFIALSPENHKALTLETFDTTKGTEAIRNYIAAKKDQILLKAYEKQLQESIERQANAGVMDKQDAFFLSVAKGFGFRSDMLLSTYAKVNAGIYKQEAENQKKFLSFMNSASERIEKSGYKAIESSNNVASIITEDAKKIKGDQVYPFGTIKYWDQVADKAREALSTINPNDTSSIAKFKRINQVAIEESEKLKNELFNNFDEELEYKRSQYELYNRWVQFQSKEVADKQFSELIKSGDSYTKFLQNKISELEAKSESSELTSQELKDLTTAKYTLNLEVGGLDQFKNGLEEIKNESTSLTQYLETLQDILSSLGTNKVEEKNIVNEKIDEATKQRIQLFKDFVKETEIGEAKRLSITEKYNNLRKAANDKSLKMEINARKEAVERLNEAESDEITQSLIEEIQKKAPAFKEIDKIIMGSDSDVLKHKIKNLEIYIEALKNAGLITSQEYQSRLSELNGLKNQLLNIKTQGIANVMSAISGIGSGLSSASGQVGDFTRQLSNLYDEYQRFATAKKSDTGFAITEIATKTMVEILNAGIDAFERKAKTEEEYFKRRAEFQTEYNRLLLEETRLRTVNQSNLFYTDYASIIKDSLAAQSKAMESIKLIKPLEMWGKAVDGTETGANGWKVLKSLLSNPIAGLFNSSETRDKFIPILEKYPKLIDKTKEGFDQLNLPLAKLLLNSDLLDKNARNLLQALVDGAEEYKKAVDQIKDVIKDLVGEIGDDLRNSLVQAFKDGTSAAEAFAASVSRSLERVLASIIFNSIWSKRLKQLEADLLKSDVNDYGKVIKQFFKDSKGLADVTHDTFEIVRKEAKAEGLDIFSPTSGSDPNSLTGQVRNLTEETGSALLGQFNAFRITSAQAVDIARVSLSHLSRIENYTLRTAIAVEELVFRSKTTSLDAAARAWGQ